MKKILVCLMASYMVLLPLAALANESADNSYNMIIEGQDWGPSVSKLVIKGAKSTNITDYQVQVVSELNDVNISNQEVNVTDVYFSDEKGNLTEGNSEYISLTLKIGPDYQATNPFYFDYVAFANYWLDMQFTITDKSTGKVFDTMGTQYKLIVDEFKKDVFSYEDPTFGNIELSNAFYEPAPDNKKNALIIWLHGMGEGGVDPDLVLLGNEVTVLADELVQTYFDGAYVLAPQSPTFWLDQGDGNTTVDGTSKYSEALFALIDEFVSNNPDIDTEKIMIGGCSNGGYMTMRMIIDHPEYFAAAFPICEALYNDYVTDENIQKIKHMPIWFTHAMGDDLAEPEYITIPTYQRLMEANALNTHFTFFEGVQDTSGKYFMEDGETPYQYHPHFSWISVFNHEAIIDFDGLPVYANGEPVTLFKWLSLQTKQPSLYEALRFMDLYGGVVFSLAGVALIIVTIIVAGKKKEVISDDI